MHQGADATASGSKDERIWEQTRLNLGRRSPTDLGGGLTGLFYNTIMINENSNTSIKRERMEKRNNENCTHKKQKPNPGSPFK